METANSVRNIAKSFVIFLSLPLPGEQFDSTLHQKRQILRFRYSEKEFSNRFIISRMTTQLRFKIHLNAELSWRISLHNGNGEFCGGNQTKYLCTVANKQSWGIFILPCWLQACKQMIL
ncbi:hypothetical protein CEXT_218991 [Caerostris extrusa]|uniref:Uncharacterized protein n=1 Tax=Caerostris extrusa TaxID=172846 RepID=A0AAV4WU12_CAEEX|nr:hypothetical protein CEXT_218991 [Caerostris extrusa]